MHSEAPLGQLETIESLWRAAARGRLAHALLFTGPEGVGKFRSALYFAHGLLCEEGPGAPCGACKACKRAQAGSHAGLYVLDPAEHDREQLPIWMVTPRPEHADFHTVEEFLALKAVDGAWRVVVLRDFDLAGVPTQNALLKTLEEPGAGVVLVLETSRPRLLLETIESRCVRVVFGPLSASDAAAVLAREGLVGEEAERLVRWAQGAPGRALELARKSGPTIIATLAEVACGTKDPLVATGELRELKGDFVGKTPLGVERSRARLVLDLALQLLRDVLELDAGAEPEALPLSELAVRLPGSPSRTELARVLAALLSAREDVDMNLAPEGVLDRALLALSDLRRPSPDPSRARPR